MGTDHTLSLIFQNEAILIHNSKIDYKVFAEFEFIELYIKMRSDIK